MRGVLVVVACAALLAACAAESKVSAIAAGKMNENGEYIHIRGINFIAMANGIWRDEVHHAIQDHAPVLGEYINPLPGNSYHMTVHPLFTERFFPEFFKKKYESDWDSMWIHMMNLLTPHIYKLQKELPSELHPEFLRPLVGSGVTVLVLKLPREEALSMANFRGRIRDTIGAEMLNLLMAEASSTEDRTAVQEWYDKVFVEPSSTENAMSYKYHLTLGYSRKLAEALTASELNSLDEESDMVDAVVKNLVCPDYEKPGDSCVLNLQSPNFYWFTSMTAFDEIQSLWNKEDKPLLNMFFKTFPIEDDPYGPSTTGLLWILVFCLSMCCLLVLYCIYKRRPFSRFFRSKRMILPMTSSKMG